MLDFVINLHMYVCNVGTLLVHSEFVSWLPAAGQHQSARQDALGVRQRETRRCVAEPVAQPDAGRHSGPPAVPPLTAFPELNTGVLELLTVCQPACSVTVQHPAQPISTQCIMYNGIHVNRSKNVHIHLTFKLR